MQRFEPSMAFGNIAIMRESACGRFQLAKMLEERPRFEPSLSMDGRVPIARSAQEGRYVLAEEV